MEKGQLEAFFAQDSIEILRKTKRSEKITDIKPWIYKLELRGDKVWMQLSQGSVHNLKPELVMEAFAKFLGIELEPFALMIHREESMQTAAKKRSHSWYPWKRWEM